MRATVDSPEASRMWTWQAALRVVLCIALSLAALTLCLNAATPPAPVSRSADLAALSGQRAAETLDLLLGTGPHPVASDGNRIVRDRILKELRRLGYAPKLQHSLSCHPGLCAEVDNIFFKVPGSHPDAGTILLAAHYDSVPAAQGAADDGIGTASLIEFARALKHRPPTKQNLLFLLTDGEEAGLLGMRAFVTQPDFHAVTYVINLEARGNRGPMLLFETANGDAPLVAAYGEHARQPLTSSLFQSVYRELPNDTDFSITLQAGRRGLNFACIGGVEHYHTAYDDLEHLNLATLQHSLDNLDAALAGIDELAGTDAAAPVEAEPNYFDLLGRRIVFLPAWFGYLATLLGLFIPCGIAAWRRSTLRWRALFGSLGLTLCGLLLSVLLNAGFGLLLQRLGRAPAPWVAHGSYIVVTAAGFGLIWLFWQAGLNRDHRDLPSLEQSIAIGLLFGLLGLALLGLLPGAAYLGYLPSLGLALLDLAVAFVRREHPGASERRVTKLAWLVWGGGAGVGFCVAIVWFPVLTQLYAALGLIALPAMGALWLLWGLSLLPLLPAQSRRILPWAALLLACVAAVALLQKPYTSDVPQRASVGVVYDATKQSGRVLVDVSHGPVPPRLGEVLKLDSPAGPSFPWLGGWRDLSESGPSDWKSPIRSNLQAVKREQFPDGIHFELDWRRQLWAEAVSFSLPQGTPLDVRYVLNNGAAQLATPKLVQGPSEPTRSTPNTWQRWLLVGNPRQPLRVLVNAPSSVSRLQLLVCEHRFKLPDDVAREVEAKRPSNAVPSQSGDNTAICHTEFF
ncbi:MAG: M28 family peptidase [Polyangiaceae bacterium]